MLMVKSIPTGLKKTFKNYFVWSVVTYGFEMWLSKRKKKSVWELWNVVTEKSGDCKMDG